MSAEFAHRFVDFSVTFIVMLAMGVAGSKLVAQDNEDSPRTEDAKSRQEAPDSMRNEVAPGVVVFGRANRFAEIGNSQDFDSSPDGRTLVFASSKLKFFDLVENEIVAQAGEPGERYQFVAYSPDGRYVFGFTRSGRKSFVRVIDAITQESVGTITTETEEDPNPNQYINPQKIIVSADAKYVGLLTYNDIQVRDVQSGELAMHVKDLGYVQDAAFSPDEAELIIPQGASLKVYDIDSGEELTRADSKLVGQSGRYMSIDYGRKLLAISQSRSVTLFDLAEEKKAGTISMPAGTYAQNVRFSDDGSRLAISSYLQSNSGGGRYRIQIADVDAKKVIETVSVACQRITKVAFSMDGKSIFVSGSGIYGAQEIKLGQEDELAETKYPSGPSQVCAIHPSGESFISCTQGGEVTWFDAANGEVVRSIQKPNASSIEISPDGSEVVLSSRSGNDKSVSRLDYESGEEIKSYALKAAARKAGVFTAIKTFMAKGGPNISVHSQMMPISVKTSEDGERVNALIMEMNLEVVVVGIGVEPQQTQEFYIRFLQLDAETGKKLASNRFSTEKFGFGKNEWVQSGAIHPDGSQFVVNKGKKVYVVESETGDVIDELEASGHIIKIDYSPDGKFFYGSHYQGVSVWDSESRVEVQKIEMVAGNPKVAFSKSGNRMAICPNHSASDLEVYSTKTWKVTKSRNKTEANRTSLAFSENGQKLLIGLSDCRLELWDLALID